MQQMEVRESIEEVVDEEEPLDALDEIKADVKQQAQQLEQHFQQYYTDNRLEQAKDVVLKMRFMERIFSEIRRLEEKLEDDYF
jgi:molecular chaperone HscB